MFAHLAEAEAICHTLQEIGLSPSFKQRQWEVWPRSFTISQSHFYEALSSKVQSLHQGRFLHYVTVQSIHWRLWSLQKSWFWPLKIYVSYAQGKKKKLQLVTYYWRPNLCSAFCITAVSHSSLFMALKRSVMEHVKKGVFVGQLWKEARNSQLTARGKHWFLSSCKAEWGSMKKNQKKKTRKTDKYRSEQWTRKMNLTREVMTSNQPYCVLSTQCNCELEYRLCCAIPRLNIIVLPSRTKTAITEHKSNHFISNTMQWMPWVWFWVRQHRSGNVYGLHW